MTNPRGSPDGGIRPRVLVCGDDSISAPGLRELVRALGACQSCDVYVCAPIDERSATSHAITLSPSLSGISCDVPGAVEAFAVNGTPADCVLLALCAPVFSYQV
jgi:5'-nucleotidase